MSRRLPSCYLALLLAGAAGAWASSPKQEPEPASEYLDIKPALIANYGGPGPIHFLKAEISLRIGKDPGANKKVAHHMPRIRHELVMLLSSQNEEAITSMEGKEQLRNDALAALQKIFQEESGRPLVEDLLFTNFVVQR